MVSGEAQQERQGSILPVLPGQIALNSEPSRVTALGCRWAARWPWELGSALPKRGLGAE